MLSTQSSWCCKSLYAPFSWDSHLLSSSEVPLYCVQTTSKFHYLLALLGIGCSVTRFLDHSMSKGCVSWVVLMICINSAPRRYAELTEVYGPVFSLRYGSRIVCVIGRHQVSSVSLAYASLRWVHLIAGGRGYSIEILQ